MMRDLDAMIDEALDAEEKELLRTLDEPGFFSQAFGIFSGPAGWASVLVIVVQAAIFVAGLWAAWHFFQANDAVTQLRWGLPAAVAMIVTLVMKTSLMPRIESNRVLLALKRVELQVAHLSRR